MTERQPPPSASQWEGSLRWVWALVAVLLALLVAGYRYGIPALASVASEHVPERLIQIMSEETLKMVDAQMFEPTRLERSRQAQLAQRFNSLRAPDDERKRDYRIEFRTSDGVGPNALALPSGLLVVTDALVALAEDDAEIIAVLAHEAGHVERRHGLRLVFQSSFLALALTWFVGDVGTLLAGAPAALMEAKYSRDLEREADAYAVSVLRANDISLQHLVRMLERLDASAREAPAGTRLGVLDYLSSHPVTSERLEAIRGGGSTP
jgi:Zn-dependent protease with chaperone function